MARSSPDTWRPEPARSGREAHRWTGSRSSDQHSGTCGQGWRVSKVMHPSMQRITLVVLLGALVVGCGTGDGTGEQAEKSSVPPPIPHVKDTVPIACKRGKRPDYFVPADPGPIVIVGCARVGVSGATVEFSINREPIGRKVYTCVNPAYPAKGRRAGTYIPATCLLSAGRRLDVVDFRPPRQGLGQRYERVIWGTSPTFPHGVIARSGDERTPAALLHVGGDLAERAGVKRPFSLFVTELPNETACDESTIELLGGSATERIPPRPGVCRGRE